MTDFLVRVFVPNYKEIEDASVRTRYGLMASLVGICCNVVLCIVKVLAGFLTGSISVMADAFNNLSDAASSVVGFVGVKMAEKPADDDHPFGHGRIEYIAAFIVSFFVIQVGFSLFQSSIKKIINPEEMTFHVVSVGILLATILVKLWMAAFNRKLGKRINSNVLLATATDSMGDAVATTATIISILVFGIWGINLDGITGVIVSILVMIAGINIAKETLAPLIGEAIDPKVYEEIKQFVENYDGIIGSHDLIVHNYGPNRSMASIHAEVRDDVNIQVSHEIVDAIERDAYKKLGIFLVIHMDPIGTNDERSKQFYQVAVDVVASLDSRLTLHDFRVVDGENQINLIFDLVLPRNYTREMQDALKQQIYKKVQEQDKRCYCVITIENSYL